MGEVFRLAASRAQAQEFSQQVGEWELRTRLTDLNINHVTDTVDGETTNVERRFNIRLEARHQLNEQVNVGLFVGYFGEGDTDANGDYTNRTRSWSLVPRVEYMLSDSLGAALSVGLSRGANIDDDANLVNYRLHFTAVPRVFYRTALNDKVRLEPYGEVEFYTYKDYDADGSEYNENSQYALMAGVESRYYIAPNFSVNFIPRVILLNRETHLDDDVARRSTRFNLVTCFSLYF